MAKYRLYGGGREGEVVDELPDGFKTTGTGHGVGSTMENEYPMTAVLIPDDNDETVYLQYGLDDDADGVLIPRAQLPDEAYESAGSITAEPAGGEPGVLYPLWIVETNDSDFG